MNAGELAAKYGKALVGMEIVTERIGAFPGGLRRVVEVEPNPKSGRFVFTVDWREKNTTAGIFAWEEVQSMSQLRDDGTFDDSYDHHASAR